MSIDSCFVITMEHDASGCTKKSRKPYTLTKQRESWTNDEHERFIKALQLYNRDWKKIESYVGTKTVVQIRSHAQKYFQKVIKSGSTDAIPPPRPKRRATDPPLASQASCVFPDTKQSRVVLEGPARANSAKAEVDSDEVQHNSKQEMASLRSNDAVDAPIQLESARAVVSSQHLQHVYLFLASLFSQTPSNHTAMLAGLSERDRQLVTRLLKVSGEELAAQQQQLQQSAGQLQQPQSATHSEEQQQQQLTPAIPGAQAAQDLAAAVQESLATAAKQHFTAGKGQKGTTLQNLASMSLPMIKKEAVATGMLGPESINGDQAKEAAATAATAATAAAESSMPDSTPITDTGQPVVLTQAHEQQAQQQSEQERLQGIADIQVTSTKDTHMLDALRHVGPVPAAEQLCLTVPGDPAVASAPEPASLDKSQQQTAGQTAALQQNVSPGPAAAAAAVPAAPAGDNEEAQPSNTLVMAEAAKCANQAIGSDEQHSQQAGTDLPAAAAAIAPTAKSVPPQTLCAPEPAQQPPMQCVGAAAGAAGGSAMGFHAYDVPAPLN